MSDDKKTLTVQIDSELHKKLRTKLSLEGKTYKDWAIEQVKRYVADLDI
jgi:predicted HicB family RNase H-like nuclease